MRLKSSLLRALALIVIFACLSSTLASAAVHAANTGSHCIIVVKGNSYRLLCIAKSKFFGSYEEMAALSSKTLEILYRGMGPRVSGVMAVSLNATLLRGTIVINLKSILGSGSAAVSESISSIVVASSKSIRVESFKYSILFPLINASLGKNVSIDISSGVAKALKNLKYIDSVGKASLAIYTKRRLVEIEVSSEGMVVDRVIYQALKGLSGVCRYLTSASGTLTASVALSGHDYVATLKLSGNATRVLLTLACLAPLALSVGYTVMKSYGALGSAGRILSEALYISSISKLGSAIPRIVNSIVKPLIVEYEGMPMLGVIGVKTQVYGNGSVAALNMTMWPVKVLTNASDVSKLVDTVYRVVFAKEPLRSLEQDFPVSTAKIYIASENHTATNRLSTHGSSYFNMLLYVLIAIVAAQVAIITFIVLKLVRKR